MNDNRTIEQRIKGKNQCIVCGAIGCTGAHFPNTKLKSRTNNKRHGHKENW